MQVQVYISNHQPSFMTPVDNTAGISVSTHRTLLQRYPAAFTPRELTVYESYLLPGLMPRHRLQMHHTSPSPARGLAACIQLHPQCLIPCPLECGTASPGTTWAACVQGWPGSGGQHAIDLSQGVHRISPDTVKIQSPSTEEPAAVTRFTVAARVTIASLQHTTNQKSSSTRRVTRLQVPFIWKPLGVEQFCTAPWSFLPAITVRTRDSLNRHAKRSMVQGYRAPHLNIHSV